MLIYLYLMKSRLLILCSLSLMTITVAGTLACDAKTTPYSFEKHESAFTAGKGAGGMNLVVLAPEFIFSPGLMSYETIVTPAATRGSMIVKYAVIPAKAWRTVFHKARDAVS
jgi:hypothetical protein